MATFLTGQTFGATEQVTNTKLHNMVNLASISNIQASEFSSNLLPSLPTTVGTLPITVFSNNFLSSLASAFGKIPAQNLSNLTIPATNASLIDISISNILNLFYSTFGSLATFINARIGQRFTLVAQQASFPCLVTLGNFKLVSNFIPLKQYNNITLIWDGSVFVEIGRASP